MAQATGEGDIAVRIHEIRKHMKKLRGLLRLVRPVFPDYDSENACFRDIAASIAHVRDAEIVSATFDKLIDTHADALDLKAFAGIRAELAREKVEAPDLTEVMESLQLARERTEIWTLRETGWDAISGGLARTYRQARKRRKAKDDEGLHAWRKPIKYHWYHVRLLHDICPEEMEKREKAADQLGEYLGLRQDLAVLDRRAKQSALPKETRRVLHGLIERRKAETLEEVKDLIPQLLADKPGKLIARWGELWDAWRG